MLDVPSMEGLGSGEGFAMARVLLKESTDKEEEYARRGNVPGQRPYEIDPERIQRRVRETPSEIQKRAPLG